MVVRKRHLVHEIRVFRSFLLFCNFDTNKRRIYVIIRKRHLGSSFFPVDFVAAAKWQTNLGALAALGLHRIASKSHSNVWLADWSIIQWPIICDRSIDRSSLPMESCFNLDRAFWKFASDGIKLPFLRSRAASRFGTYDTRHEALGGSPDWPIISLWRHLGIYICTHLQLTAAGAGRWREWMSQWVWSSSTTKFGEWISRRE